MQPINCAGCLPDDWQDAVLVGRVWRPAPVAGPSVVAVRNGHVFDITHEVPTVADLLDAGDAVALARGMPGEPLGPAVEWLENSVRAAGNSALPHLIAPCDVQPIKACGVTFAASLVERIVEEQAGGDTSKAAEARAAVRALIGADLSSVRPGSEAAARLKEACLRRGTWSQYLEVGLGPDAEVFSKAQPLSSVGFGADVGLSPDSRWNNPEPEIVLAVDPRGEPVGATLGNDVNLRDIEGRSALLLGKAKDNNGSCALGPFIRLFDDRFTLDSVRRATVALRVEGEDDGFTLAEESRMSAISRDPLDLVQQTIGPHHQYPDGFMLFLGTMFSPVADRDTPDAGFTHHLGDRVTITTPTLGALVNHVRLSTAIPPWHFGVRALYRNLITRGLMY